MDNRDVDLLAAGRVDPMNVAGMALEHTVAVSGSRLLTGVTITEFAKPKSHGPHGGIPEE